MRLEWGGGGIETSQSWETILSHVLTITQNIITVLHIQSNLMIRLMLHSVELWTHVAYWAN